MSERLYRLYREDAEIDIQSSWLEEYPEIGSEIFKILEREGFETYEIVFDKPGMLAVDHVRFSL